MVLQIQSSDMEKNTDTITVTIVTDTVMATDMVTAAMATDPTVIPKTKKQIPDSSVTYASLTG